MNGSLGQLVAERFATFTAPYLAEPGENFAYRLKVEHTARVAQLAHVICAGEAIRGDVATAAILAAQLHDVGRFPQYRRYRSFRDIETADHAALSVRSILHEHMLADAPKNIVRAALGAVYLHNKRTLPAGLPPALDAAARVVRDSDKLDIFKVMIEHFAQDPSAHPEVTLHVTDDPDSYSPEALECLLRRKPGEYARMKWVNDFKLLIIGWLYDMNFRTSCTILKDRGYLTTVFATLPRTPDIDKARAQVASDLARRASGD